MRMRARFLSSHAAALAVALSLSLPAAAQTSRSGPSGSIGVDLSRISIENFGQINGNYYRGAQPEGRDYADLAALGVKTVIDLQADGERNEEQLVRAAGMQFVRIPMTTRVPPTERQLAQFLDLVSNSAAQPVYVHCAGGKHRTGVMTALYRMTSDGWTADQAYDEMKQYRFGLSLFHPEFKRFVYDFYEDRPNRQAARGTAAAIATN